MAILEGLASGVRSTGSLVDPTPITMPMNTVYHTLDAVEQPIDVIQQPPLTGTIGGSNTQTPIAPLNPFGSGVQVVPINGNTAQGWAQAVQNWFTNFFTGGNVFAVPAPTAPPSTMQATGTQPSSTLSVSGVSSCTAFGVNWCDLLLWIALFTILFLGLLGLILPSPDSEDTQTATQLAEVAAA